MSRWIWARSATRRRRGKACQRTTCSGPLYRRPPRPRRTRSRLIRPPQPRRIDERGGPFGVAGRLVQGLTPHHLFERLVGHQHIPERAAQCRRRSPDRRELDRPVGLGPFDLGDARLRDPHPLPQFELAHPERLADRPDPPTGWRRPNPIVVAGQALVQSSPSGGSDCEGLGGLFWQHQPVSYGRFRAVPADKGHKGTLHALRTVARRVALGHSRRNR